MLWIVWGTGTIGMIYVVIKIILEISERNWHNILINTKKFIKQIAIGAVGMLGLYWVSSFNYEEVVKTNQWELVSLLTSDNGQNIRKKFIILNANGEYSFYHEANNGVLVVETIDVDDTAILKENDVIPYAVEYTIYIKNRMIPILYNFLTFGINIEKNYTNYEIYVPSENIFLRDSTNP